MSSTLFTVNSQEALKILVEVSGIPNRQEYLKLIRKGGGQITHHAKEANIILVDPESEGGQRFTASWINEPHKVILDVIWVKRCVEREKLLDASENWGGFRVLRAPEFDDDDDDDEVNQQVPGLPEPSEDNYLATPRPTPVIEPTIPDENPIRLLPHIPSPPVKDTENIIPIPADTNCSMLVDSNDQPTPETVARIQALINKNPQLFVSPSTPNKAPSDNSPKKHSSTPPAALIPSRSEKSKGKAKAVDDEPIFKTPSSLREKAKQSPRNSLHRAPSLQGPLSAASSPSPSESFFSGRSFWVQPDAKGRKDIVQIIKKHGGTMSNDFTMATHCIMSIRSSKTYKEMYPRILRARKLPLGPSWLQKCQSVGHVVNAQEWVLDRHGELIAPAESEDDSDEDSDDTEVQEGAANNHAGPRAQDRTLSSDLISSPVKGNSRKDGDPATMEDTLIQLFAATPNSNTKPQPIFNLLSTLFPHGPQYFQMYYYSNYTRLQAAIAQVRGAAQPMTRGMLPRSLRPAHYTPEQLLDISEQLPPPPTTVIHVGAGKAKYTEEDQAFLWAYCRHALLKDPYIPVKQLADAVSDYVPHHSHASWQSYLSRRDEELETIRKQAIRTRKAFPDAFPRSNPSSPFKRDFDQFASGSMNNLALRDAKRTRIPE